MFTDERLRSDMDAFVEQLSVSIIPDTAREKPMEGKVIAVGAGRIDKDGKTIVQNETWMTPDAGGTKGLDHAAVQPHTAGREARSCAS